MRVIIAGSRNIGDMWALEAAIRQADFEITEVVSGRAAGVDTLGEIWADLNGIPKKLFAPDRKKHGWPKAAFVRNAQMADYADALIAVWDGESHGTKHMIECARKKGLKVHVFLLDPIRYRPCDRGNS
jgi:hypothetical protein